MSLIGVSSGSGREAEPYIASLVSRGGSTRLLTPAGFVGVTEAMDGIGGLLLTGGHDLSPHYYGQEADPSANVETHPERDDMEMALLRHALDSGMPVLGICRGMQLINVAFGGSLLQDIPGHRDPVAEGGSLRHSVYVSPGSKLGAVIGAGAIYRVNSLHHQGLKEAQRAPGLLASAYHPEDGIVEGLESPAHRLLLAVQCHPERESEVPKGFLKLFDWLVGWAERFEAGDLDAEASQGPDLV